MHRTHTSALHAVNNGPTVLHTLHKPTLLIPGNPAVTIPWVVPSRLTLITTSSKAKGDQIHIITQTSAKPRTTIFRLEKISPQQ